MKRKRANSQRNLIGQRFGKLIVVKPLGYYKQNDLHYWSLVRCDCGFDFPVQDTLLIYNRRTQCPECSRRDRKTHGMSNTSLFHIWGGMRGRCYNPNNSSFPDYGGRGITVCDEWNSSFESFAEWSFNNGYREGLSIDRINVNGNYEPENCRWADNFSQARNRRDTIYVDYEGKRLPMQEVAEITGIKAGTIQYRLYSGWSDYDATHIKAGCSGRYSNGMWKRRVYLNKKGSNEVKEFESCSVASKYLGHNAGYLGTIASRKQTKEFDVGDYHVKVEEHCYKL